MCTVFIFFFKQKTAYEMRISDWSSDVCSSDLRAARTARLGSLNTGMPPSARIRAPSGDDASQATTIGLAERAANAASPSVSASTLTRQIGRASWRERVCQYG